MVRPTPALIPKLVDATDQSKFHAIFGLISRICRNRLKLDSCIASQQQVEGKSSVEFMGFRDQQICDISALLSAIHTLVSSGQFCVQKQNSFFLTDFHQV